MKKFLQEIRGDSGLDNLLERLSLKKVPRHRFSFAYLLGGLTLFFLAAQIATGALLLFYYSPTPATAYESVQAIERNVWGGWLVRSLHHWSADLLVITLFAHFGSTLFLRAYRAPRQITWLSGVVLLFLVLGFCFTGSLLPWDVRAYFATQIGTEIPRSIPLLGPFVVSLLRGGPVISAESLTRLFALHVAILPLAAVLLVFYHFMLNLKHGSSVPPSVQENAFERFYPGYVLKEMIAWLICAIVLVWIAALAPVGLGTKADALAAAPAGIRPEWYFWPMYATLKIAPQTLFGVSGELLVNIGVALLGLAFVLVPWLDRQGDPNRWSRPMLVGGGILMAYIGFTIVYTAAGG